MHLGGPQILVKCHDATGFRFGGNKTRKLEFLIAAALAEGADMLRQAARRRATAPRPQPLALGFTARSCCSTGVDWNRPDYERGGNVLLDRLTGAELHLVECAAARPGAG